MNTYQANTQACNEIINDLMGDLGKTNFEGEELQSRVDKPLITSSRKAIESVFKDPKLGQSAFNYLSGLKSTEGKSPEEQESGDFS